MPDIYRRNVAGKTVWYAKLWVEGKLLSRSTGTASKRLATQRAKQMQCDLTQPRTTPTSAKRFTLTPDDAWSAYTAWAVHHKLPNTLSGESHFWKQFWSFQGGSNLYGVTRDDVEGFKRHLATTPGPQGRARSPHTVNDALRHLATPEILNTDQRCRLTNDAIIQVLKNAGIQTSMEGKGRWVDNVFIERRCCSFKYEEVYLNARRSCPMHANRFERG